MITPKLYRRRSSFISQPIHLPHQKRNVQFFWSEDGQYLFQPPLKKIDKGGTLFGTLAPIKGTFKNSRLKRLPRWIHARARADSQQQFKTNVSEPQWDGWGHFGCRTTKESIDLAFPPKKKWWLIMIATMNVMINDILTFVIQFWVKFGVTKQNWIYSALKSIKVCKFLFFLLPDLKKEF